MNHLPNLITAATLLLPFGLSADPGTLSRTVDGKRIDCPLKHTDVRAKISGPLATVTVRQDFVNNSPHAIEALYTFPLPDQSAVYGYTMLIGERQVRGKIATREDAQKAYEDARRQGKSAGLLDQERPNVFRQALANIPAGAKISVEIHYVEIVPYENQTYEFVFPMVVGPRYFPQGAAGAERVNAPVAAKGTRAGHDISLSVLLESPHAPAEITSPTHAIKTEGAKLVKLLSTAEIPNKDFVLRYRVGARDVAPTVLTHAKNGQGYFSLVLDPPSPSSAVRTLEMNITPKELVFVIDTSGSMNGFPLDKAKEAMLLAMDGLNPRDTFNLITFAGDTHVLWPSPQPATEQNVNTAKRFLESRQGGGGTEMMKAIRAAFAGMESQEHLRVICFMTDGYIGNESQILEEIRRHPQARVFSFGIGDSVNRHLLNQMAEAGRGEVEHVLLNSDGSAAARRFHERVRNPLLTDITVEFIGLNVQDLSPARVPDLFSAKPVILSGRYTGAASGIVRLRGKRGGKPYVRDIPVTLPAAESKHAAVPLVWARRQIQALSANSRENQAAITRLGLEYGLMTEFTSYVAVEDKVVNEGGKMQTIEVPVEMPNGVSHEGVFGMGAGRSGMAKLSVAQTFLQVDRADPLPAAIEEGRNETPTTFPLNRVNIKILLKRADAAAVKQLIALGFVAKEGQPAGALFLEGSIDSAKLAALKQLPFVTRVEVLQL
ncbi:MAG: VIT and VWA domain-containing protein [Bryobacter sp.]|nr:VIT and VWA domain-containing protein [Bryobacter sp.]